jgi:L-fuconolactonase
MVPCIDAHHHLWRYTAAEYGWISDAMRGLQRDFLPGELRREMDSAGVQATICVQARQSMQETEALLRLAGEYPWIAGVVGWAGIASDDFPARLERLLGNRKLKGLRHVLQDEPDPAFALRPEFQRGLSAMKGTGLVYDILIYAPQLPVAAELAGRHPEQVFVLDHLAKPRIAAGEVSPWRENLRELARRPNVWCKLSGMVTEAHWQQWTADELRPYLDAALEAFGPGRLLAGSDWPVCTLASSYSRWWQVLREWAEQLSSPEQQAIFAGNAVEVYRLETEP